MANNEQIPQLEPIIVTPEGEAQENLLSRVLSNMDVDTANKIINRFTKRVKKDATKAIIGGDIKTQSGLKKVAKETQKLASTENPLAFIESKVDKVSELGSKEYLMETLGEAVLTEAEIALNKRLKSTGLKVDLPTNITDINKIREGDYSDFTRGGFQYNLGKGWKVKGSAKVSKEGDASWKVGVGFKRDFDMPEGDMVIRAFKNLFGKEEE
jgi:hypothetical protein